MGRNASSAPPVRHSRWRGRTSERAFGQGRDEQLRRRVHRAAGADMATEHAARGIGQAGVQMSTVGRQAAAEGEDLERAFEAGRSRLAGQAQLRMSQAADAGDDKARQPLQRAAQVVARVQAQRLHQPTAAPSRRGSLAAT